MTTSINTKLIAKLLRDNGLRAILVGGSVRDFFLGDDILSKDVDIEVHGDTDFDRLSDILSLLGKVDVVGKSFGVVKLTINKEDFDISLPRKEEKAGSKHTDFKVSFENVSLEHAFIRRDFTVNAIGFDILAEQWIDFFDGVDDAKSKILKVTNRDSFMEDPLRVLRAIQLASRFNLTIEEGSLELLKTMTSSGMLNDLPKERIHEELRKLFLKSEKPSVGLSLMREIGVTAVLFPELHALIDVPQSPVWHPEGDVWIHTLMAVDEMALLKTGDDDRDFMLMIAILSHDLGKPEFTVIGEDGNWTSRGHEAGGVKPTVSFMNRFTNSKDLIDTVSILVEQHLAPALLFRAKAGPKSIRKLASKLGFVSIEDLSIVAKADALGRTTESALNRESLASEWLLEMAKDINVHEEAEKPIVRGRDLIALGMTPGVHFGDILKQLFAEQLEENLTEDNKDDFLNNFLKIFN